jgi:pyruvate/2-oxoacid:ferredoxin oxidoreductase alpha subunit
LVNSLVKHDKVIHENEANIINMRSEIEAISAMVGAQRKRFHSSSVASKKKERSSR